MQEQKQKFKNPPAVRAYLAKVKRDYRAKQKQKAEGVEVTSPDSNSPRPHNRTPSRQRKREPNDK